MVFKVRIKKKVHSRILFLLAAAFYLIIIPSVIWSSYAEYGDYRDDSIASDVVVEVTEVEVERRGTKNRVSNYHYTLEAEIGDMIVTDVFTASVGSRTFDASDVIDGRYLIDEAGEPQLAIAEIAYHPTTTFRLFLATLAFLAGVILLPIMYKKNYMN